MKNIDKAIQICDVIKKIEFSTYTEAINFARNNRGSKIKEGPYSYIVEYEEKEIKSITIYTYEADEYSMFGDKRDRTKRKFVGKYRFKSPLNAEAARKEEQKKLKGSFLTNVRKIKEEKER